MVELASGAVREAALKWLKEKRVSHSPLMSSSWGCVTSYIARCKEHVDCAKQWLFRAIHPECVQMEAPQSCSAQGTLVVNDSCDFYYLCSC